MANVCLNVNLSLYLYMFIAVTLTVFSSHVLLPSDLYLP